MRQGRDDERVVAAGQAPQRREVAVVEVVVGEEDCVHPGDRAEIDSGRRDAPRPRTWEGARALREDGVGEDGGRRAPQDDRRLADPRRHDPEGGGRGRQGPPVDLDPGRPRLGPARQLPPEEVEHAPFGCLAGIEECFPVEVVGRRRCHRVAFSPMSLLKSNKCPPRPRGAGRGTVRISGGLARGIELAVPRGHAVQARDRRDAPGRVLEPWRPGRGRPVRGPVCRERRLRARGLQQGRVGRDVRRAQARGPRRASGGTSPPSAAAWGGAGRSWSRWRPTRSRCPRGSAPPPTSSSRTRPTRRSRRSRPPLFDKLAAALGPDWRGLVVFEMPGEETLAPRGLGVRQAARARRAPAERRVLPRRRPDSGPRP